MTQLIKLSSSLTQAAHTCLLEPAVPAKEKLSSNSFLPCVFNTGGYHLPFQLTAETATIKISQVSSPGLTLLDGFTLMSAQSSGWGGQMTSPKGAVTTHWLRLRLGACLDFHLLCSPISTDRCWPKQLLLPFLLQEGLLCEVWNSNRFARKSTTITCICLI